MGKSKQKLDREILFFLSNQEAPVGAVQLSVLFGEQLGISQATIGRRLFYMDHMGYTTKIKKMGRMITKKGLKYLGELERTLKQDEVGNEFLNALNSDDFKRVIDILVARRGLERESAYLAAKNASPEELSEIESILLRQIQTINQGKTAADEEDRNFHHMIAVASKNIVLAKAIDLLREQNALASHMATARKMIGGNIYLDHELIFERIKAKDSEGAAKAMETHIDKMITEFSDYDLQNRSPKEHTAGQNFKIDAV